MSLGLSPKMVVREVMSSPVVTMPEDGDVTGAAKLMRDQKIGAVIVTSPDGQPVGIVTERDIVIRVVAEGKPPKDLKVRDVMSSPLKVVRAETTLINAMRLMDRMSIRRLGVTYKGGLVGMVSDRDLIRIMPTIVEIAREESAINGSINVGSSSTVGYCDRCEVYSTNLKAVDGQFLCEDCIADEEET
jgi:signal-transduction protein with cAMP-binding, CBS, and nucleotidyltransferase domain